MVTIGKYAVLVLISFISFSSMSQSFNLKGGTSLSIMTLLDEDGNNILVENTSSDDYYMTNSLVSTFNAGATYTSKLSNSIFLESGLIISGRGSKITEFDSYSYDTYSRNTKTSSKLRMLCADITFAFHYQLNFELISTYVLMGGNVGMAFFGNIKYHDHSTTNYTSETGESEIKSQYAIGLGDAEDRFNAGPCIGLGLRYKTYFFETNYGVSFFDRFLGARTSYIHNINFTIGFQFMRNKD